MPLDFVKALREKGPALAKDLPRSPDTHGRAG